MQELMSRHKAYALSPRDCLKTTLFQKWQRMVAPPGKRGILMRIFKYCEPQVDDKKAKKKLIKLLLKSVDIFIKHK